MRFERYSHLRESLLHYGVFLIVLEPINQLKEYHVSSRAIPANLRALLSIHTFTIAKHPLELILHSSSLELIFARIFIHLNSLLSSVSAGFASIFI